MSDNDINLVLEPRETVRKGLNKVKAQGLIPAVIHNPGHDSVSVQGNYLDMLRVYQKAGKHNPVNVSVGDEKMLTMIKQVDFEPKKNELRHVVFGAIKKGQKVKAEVPIEITHGEEGIPAEREGLLIIKVMDSLEIEALPDKLIDKLEIDGSNLKEVGDKLHISDIVVPEGVEILEDLEKTLVTVEAPRAALVEDEPTEGEEGVEGEEGESGSEGEGEASEGSEKPAESGDDQKNT